jgi:uncharacterized membrane protein YdjX (TVP38/TMEM64 family)
MSKERGSHTFLRVVSGVLLAAALIVVCVLARGLSAEDILRYTPENPILAALAITLMTAAASMIPVFPMMIFYFACGMLFPFVWALIVGALGIFAEALIQYRLGVRMGSGYVDSLIAKYPKLSIIRSWKVKNDVFLTYLLRVSGLPVNMVSLFIGAMSIPLPAYLLGTYIGMLPGLISCVLISLQVKDTFTWQLVVAIVLINALSFLVAFLYNRHASRKAKP